MLNIQIRGPRINLYVKEISEGTKKNIFNQIRNTKQSLAEILLNDKKIIKGTIYQTKLPVLSQDSEMIVTSFKNDDYYDEGFSFFRKKTSDISEPSKKELIRYQNKPYLIVSYDIYYGCSFETEIADLDYTNFDEDKLSLRTLSTPFFDYPFIENIFFNKKKLVDLNRQREQKMRSKSIIYKKIITSRINNISGITFPHLFEIVSDSEIDVRIKK